MTGRNLVRMALLASCLMPSSAWAQTAIGGQAATEVPAAPSPTAVPGQDSQVGEPPQPANALGDVVVTARKREERLQDVPVSVSVVNGDALLAQGAVNVQDVARVAPGLFYQSIEPSRPNIYLRGIGTRSFDAGAESSVGTFVDGVYIGRFGGQLQDLVGVDRIEVLKGPQGALFGRNTIGGAINVITKKPTDKTEARVSGTYGRQSHFDGDTYGGSAILSGPLVAGKLFGLISASHNHLDGFQLATNTGQRYNGSTSDSVRGRLVWQAADEFQLDLIGDYLWSNNRLGFRGSDVGGLRPAIFLAKPGLTSPVNPDPYKFTTTPGVRDSERHGGGVSLTANYDGEAVALTSITAYRGGYQVGSSDLDGTAVDTLQNPILEDSSQFSQELRLSSVPDGALTFGNRINWLIGSYYYSEDIDRSEGIRVGTDNALIAFNGGVPWTNLSTVSVNTRSYALFGQVGVKITDELKLDAGLRYSSDRKRAVIGASSPVLTPFIVPVNFELNRDRTWTSLDPSVSLSYKPDRDLLLFVNYAKGFKSGALQYQAFTAALAGRVVDPEKVDAYQAGIKADVLSRRLRVNATVFEYKYKNIQVPRIEVPAGGSVPVVTLSNAARSTIRGFEVEGVAVPSDWLRVEYGYAYLDAKFDDYLYSATRDFSGNRLTRSPKNTVDLAGIVTVPLGENRLEVRGAMNYLSSFFFEPDNAKVDPGTREPGRALFDLVATLTRGPYSASIFARNLTDKGYRSSVLNISGVRLNEVYAPRRIVGLTLTAALR